MTYSSYEFKYGLLIITSKGEAVFWEHLDNIEEILHEDEQNFVTIVTKKDSGERPRELFEVSLTLAEQCKNLSIDLKNHKRYRQILKEIMERENV